MSSILTLFDSSGVFRKLTQATDLEYVTSTKNIGLKPHWDGIPDKDRNKRSGRIQSFLVTSKKNDTINAEWSRSTIFIPQSHLHTYLFYTYWLNYHPIVLKKCENTMKIVNGELTNKKCTDCFSKIDSSCPYWLWGLNIVEFNQTLTQLISHITEGISDNSYIGKWAKSLNEYEKQSILNGKTPTQFDVIKTNFKGGELILFMPGTVHWVLNPTKCDKLYVKTFIDCYSHNIEYKDETGYTLDDGAFKRNARLYEKEQYSNNKTFLDSVSLESNVESYKTDLSEENVQEIVQQLTNNGIIAISILTQQGNTDIQADIINYLDNLLEFPEEESLGNISTMKVIVNKGALLKQSKLENINIYRKPYGTQFEKNMSSIFPGASGNTGLGAYSLIGKKNGIMYDKLVETLNPIFKGMFGTDVNLDCIVFGYQGGK